VDEMAKFKIECYQAKIQYGKDMYDSDVEIGEEYLGVYSEHYSFEEALKAISELRTWQIEKKFPKTHMQYNVYIVQEENPLRLPKLKAYRYLVKHRMYNYSEHVYVVFNGAKELEEFIRKVIQVQNLNTSLDKPPELKDTIEKVFRGDIPTI